MQISSLSLQNYNLYIVCIFFKRENNFLQSCSLMAPSVETSSFSTKVERSGFTRQVDKQLGNSLAKNHSPRIPPARDSPGT